MFIQWNVLSREDRENCQLGTFHLCIMHSAVVVSKPYIAKMSTFQSLSLMLLTKFSENQQSLFGDASIHPCYNG